MHNSSLLQDLAVVMVVAGFVTILFHRLKQPVVLGYIAAGVIIGPHTPPFLLIQDKHTIETLSELGVVFLMFSLGLEFSFRKLKEVGSSAIIAAIMEIVLMLWVGYEIGRFFGWKTMDSIFLGGILAISSTTIIVKALEELGLAKENFAKLIFGVLIFEDILGILIIAILSGVAQTGSLQIGDALEAAGRLLVFLVIAIIVGILTVPRLLGYVGRFRRTEMLLVTVLGLCFAACVITLKLGYSVALGAFMMGAIIAEAREIGRIEELLEPIRDMFSAVFFVSIGLMINPRLLLDYAFPIAVISVAVVVGKVLSCSFGTFLAGQDVKTSMRVGMGLSQIGEFSFIIAALGQTLGVTSGFLYPIAVTVSAITTLTTPYLIRVSDPAVNWFYRAAPNRLTALLNVYTTWVGHVQETRSKNTGRLLLRRWSIMMVINLLFVAGVFIAGAFLVNTQPAWLASRIQHPEAVRAIVWLTAALLSAPLLVATYRKLQAFGMLLSEMSISKNSDGKRNQAAQTIVSHTVLIGGTIVIGLFLLLLSSTILQSGRALLLLLVVVGVVTAILWRPFIRIYSKAQIAVQDVFTAPPPTPHHRQLPNFLEEAELERVEVKPHSVAARKLISEIGLRSKTGASIVAIHRAGKNILNPNPSEEILPGDSLLMIGDNDQLKAATDFLNATDPKE
ncbi:MAG TPA: cation:proton antiporter [Verrucomicrobiae bacterium]